MNWKNAVVGNYQTTIAGWIAGAIFYMNQAGMNLPTTKEEAKSALAGAAIAFLGTVAKSANVGSQAK